MALLITTVFCGNGYATKCNWGGMGGGRAVDRLITTLLVLKNLAPGPVHQLPFDLMRGLDRRSELDAHW